MGVFVPQSDAGRRLIAPDGMALEGSADAAAQGNPHAALEAEMMRQCMTALNKAYPAPKGLSIWWAVQVQGGVIHIWNLSLSGKMGYVLHVKKGLTMERIVRAGGEILARYDVPRDPRHYSIELIQQKHLENDDFLINADTQERIRVHRRYLRHHEG